MPVEYPLLRWTPPSGLVREILFPDYATDFSAEVISSFAQSETAGNVVSHYSRGAYDEVSVEFIGEWSQVFADEIRAWWSHAARGGAFDFFLEGDMKDTATVIEYAYPPGNQIVVSHVGAPFIAGREAIVHPYLAASDLAKRGAFTIESITDVSLLYGANAWALGIGSPTTLVRRHDAGEIVRSKYGFPDSVILQREHPLVEEPGSIMRFSLRLRSFAGILVP